MSIEAIEKKIARVLNYVVILESLRDNCVERMRHDSVYRGSILYYLYMMADSCVALAEMVIKLKNLPKPQSYSEAIDILGEQRIIPSEFAHEFVKIAGFRNFLAHDYEKINYEEICVVMVKKLQDVRTYVQYVKSSL